MSCESNTEEDSDLVNWEFVNVQHEPVEESDSDSSIEVMSSNCDDESSNTATEEYNISRQQRVLILRISSSEKDTCTLSSDESDSENQTEETKTKHLTQPDSTDENDDETVASSDNILDVTCDASTLSFSNNETKQESKRQVLEEISAAHRNCNHSSVDDDVDVHTDPKADENDLFQDLSESLSSKGGKEETVCKRPFTRTPLKSGKETPKERKIPQENKDRLYIKMSFLQVSIGIVLVFSCGVLTVSLFNFFKESSTTSTTCTHTNSEWAEMKNKMNELRHEKEDITRNLGLMRYSSHPENNVKSCREDSSSPWNSEDQAADGQQQDGKNNEASVDKKLETIVETSDDDSDFNVLVEKIPTDEQSRVEEGKGQEDLPIDDNVDVNDDIVGGRQYRSYQSPDKTTDSHQSSYFFTNWKDDLLNKTKQMMGIIDDVKTDMWKQGQPVVSKLKQNMKETVFEAADKLSDVVHGVKNSFGSWLHDKKQGNQSQKINASTKRRGSYERTEQHTINKVKKNLRKIKKFMRNLSLKKFEEMSAQDIHDIFNKLDSFDSQSEHVKLLWVDRFWVGCQVDWWFRAALGKIQMDERCCNSMQIWQIQIQHKQADCIKAAGNCFVCNSEPHFKSSGESMHKFDEEAEEDNEGFHMKENHLKDNEANVENIWYMYDKRSKNREKLRQNHDGDPWYIRRSHERETLRTISQGN